MGARMPRGPPLVGIPTCTVVLAVRQLPGRCVASPHTRTQPTAFQERSPPLEEHPRDGTSREVALLVIPDRGPRLMISMTAPFSPPGRRSPTRRPGALNAAQSWGPRATAAPPVAKEAAR